ncbi:Vacuolar protein sorting-associated protein 54 [Perkinsus olseni]|uniref:Vacuolar protein sorting-associated protein 54 n=2 Tax=Perkinsus olseni TaxID=32597 RepID=A0A7J6PXY6_PEROL|nr:Vacuolar protein sorting-associated protein 54 [Perkinsus olseni]
MSEHKGNLMRKLGDILVERFDHHCAKWLSAEKASRAGQRTGPNENVLKIVNDVDDATVLESWRTSIPADLGQMVVKLRPIADIRARMEASVKEMLSITDRILPPKDGEPPSGDILQLLDQAEDGPKSTSSSEEETPADASTTPPAAAPAATPAAGD